MHRYVTFRLKGDGLEAPEGATDLDTPVENMKRDVTSVFKKVSNSIKREVLNRSYTISETEKSLQDVHSPTS